MKISIVVPCYNEEESIPLFYKETKKVLDSFENYDYEIIYVNDGSKDHSLDEMKKLHKKDAKVQYISFARNFGKESGLYAGLQNATGDFVAVMDVDLQDPPGLLPEMVEYLESGEFDCVATRRVSRDGEPPIRSMFARMFYKLINKMTDTEIIDGARDFRLMKRDMVDAILSLGEYHRFSKGLFSWVGFQTKWLEYKNIERTAGTTSWSFWKLFIYALEGIEAFSVTPLRILSIIGMSVSGVAVVYLIYTFARTLMIGIDVPGYASMMCVILFLGGMILTALGIIGEYISKIYMEVKHRPIYIAKENTLKNENETK